MPTTLLLDKEEMTRILERLACEVLERHGQCERVMLVGIERRGADLARRLGALMQQKLQRFGRLQSRTWKAGNDSVNRKNRARSPPGKSCLPGGDRFRGGNWRRSEKWQRTYVAAREV